MEINLTRLSNRKIKVKKNILSNVKRADVRIPKKMELVKSYTRKMMRKRIDYVEDSFQARMKTLCVRSLMIFLQPLFNIVEE